MFEALTDLGKAIVEKATPRGVVILVIWIATLVTVAFLVTACGALNYQPLERITTTIETELPSRNIEGEDNAETKQNEPERLP